jgi:hypothetical protein
MSLSETAEFNPKTGLGQVQELHPLISEEL